MRNHVTPCYRYAAVLDRVIDGDTYVLRIDVGFRSEVTATIRVRGFDAPELHGADHVRGEAAKAAAEKAFAGYSVPALVVVETYKDEQSFARWIADVYLDGYSIVDHLVKGGHVK
jgi:micrococcal nuclease